MNTNAVIELYDGITVRQLADRMNLEGRDLLKKLVLEKGLLVTLNTVLDLDLAQELVSEYGFRWQMDGMDELSEPEPNMTQFSPGTEAVLLALKARIK